MTAFYEWHHSPPPGKQVLTPYRVQLEQLDTDAIPSIAYIAGVYDDCALDDRAEHAFVIITTASCKQFSWLHHRQPVFISAEQQLQTWLDPTVTVTDAVAALTTDSTFACTRMLKDLSAEAPKGKDMQQKGIATFFGKRNHLKANEPTTLGKNALKSASRLSPTQSPAKATPSQKEAASRNRSNTTTNVAKGLKPIPAIRKPKNAPSLSKKTGQQSIRSFFSHDKKSE